MGNPHLSRTSKSETLRSSSGSAANSGAIFRRGVGNVSLSFAKTLRGHKSRPVTMLQARPHAIHFKRILDFGEGQDCTVSEYAMLDRILRNPSR